MNENDERVSSEQIRAALLVKWRGGRVQAWNFDPTLARFTFRVEAPRLPGNLHIVCGGCRHIRGPLQWQDCHFEIASMTNADDDVQQTLRDVRAGFELQCWAISCVENVEPIYAPTGATNSIQGALHAHP